jgi:hypothetical protein
MTGDSTGDQERNRQGLPPQTYLHGFLTCKGRGSMKMSQPRNHQSNNAEGHWFCPSRPRAITSSYSYRGKYPYSFATVQCEGAENNQSVSDHAGGRDIEKRQKVIETRQREHEESCLACMYTGMATCAGLSLYFAKLATDVGVPRSNRRFLWLCSAGSVATGVYRWYLG